MGSLWVCQQNQVSEPPRLGTRGWGIRQGKCHLAKSLGSSQQPSLGTTPASLRGFSGWPVHVWELHSQPRRPGSVSSRMWDSGSFCLISVWEETGRRRGEKKKIPVFSFPSKAHLVSLVCTGFGTKESWRFDYPVCGCC